MPGAGGMTLGQFLPCKCAQVRKQKFQAMDAGASGPHMAPLLPMQSTLGGEGAVFLEEDYSTSK